MIVPAPSVNVTPAGTVNALQPPHSTGTRVPDHGNDELTDTVSPDNATPLSPSPLPELPFNAPISIDALDTKIANPPAFVTEFPDTVGTPTGEDTSTPSLLRRSRVPFLN